MDIKRIYEEKDCELCDDFLSRLNSCEAEFDDVLNGSFKFSDIHKNSLKNDFVYIAIAYQDKPVGYIFSYLKANKGKVHNKNVIEIEALFVDENYRKQGIGKRLIESVDEWAKNTFGDYVIELHAINNNINSIEFYKNLGFKAARTIFRR